MPYKSNDARREHYKKNKDSLNAKRCERYNNDEPHRKKIIDESLKSYYMNHNKILKRRCYLRKRPDAKEKVRKQNKKWLKENKEKNRLTCRKRYDKIRLDESELKRRKTYYDANKERRSDYNHIYREINGKVLQKKYHQWTKTDNGRASRANGHHKRRGLGKNELFPNVFDESEKPISHHVNRNDYVWIPEDLHLLFLYGKNVEKHRENLKQIVKQLYPDFKCDG